MKLIKSISLLLSLATTCIANAQSFCSTASHSGQSVTEYSNKVSSINGIGYELWADSGNNSATFYSDGSFSCTFQNAKDYLCRSGLSFDSTKTHDQIGHMYADFKLVKQNIQNVDYSYVGIYGWSRDPLVEYYIVDNWLSQWRPGDWVGNKKHGDFTIDGAQYTVYENTRYGPSIDGDTQFKQFFSIRQNPRDCGTIDITAHFQQWEKLGMKLGKMHEAKVLGEAGSNGSGTSGTADFPYAKVYIGTDNYNNNDNTKSNDNSDQSCPTSITNKGYKCCSDNCKVVYTDSDGDWGVENNDWCGCGNKSSTSNSSNGCSSKITSKGYKCCPANCVVYYTDSDGEWGIDNGEWCGCGGNTTDENADDNKEDNNGNNTKSDYCSSAKHSGQSVTEYSNKVGNIGNVGYELWADSGNNSATFYSDGSFSCTFQNAKDYLCRSGLSFDSTKTHDQIGHMYADFKLVKQNIQNVDYSYVGIYGWSRDPLVEYYIVDNWLSQWRPGDWVGNKKHGDFTIDGAQYTVYENTRYGPSIDGDTQFKQFFSIRQNPRDCGTIDITAHFQQWEKLGMKLGKMHEAKVLGEAGSNGSGTSGTADFPYAKVYIGSNNSGNIGGGTNGEDYKEEDYGSNTKSDYCSSAKHSGQSVTEYSNKVGNIGNIGYELWADSGNNSATFYSDGSFSCTFQNAKDYLCRSGLSFDSTKTHDQIGHMYADFKLVKQNIQNVDYSYVGIYGWSRDPLVEYYIVDNWLSQWRPGDWVGNKKHGDFTIDGAQYTVYENTRYGPSIDGDTQFKQFFSIRQNPRDCGTIDITAHFQQWEKLGMKLGKMHEAKVLGEAGSNGSGTSGTADFPYAKVYIGSDNSGNIGGGTNGEDYKEENYGSKSDYCSSAKHSGQSVTEYSNKVSSINGIGYELWADSGNNSATFYSDGSFSCTFQNAKDYLCRSGLSFDSTKTHDQIGHMYADFKLVKQNIQNVDYSYVGIYGWSRSPLVEYYIVDNWLSQWRPGDWVGNKKHGDFTIDGAQYTVYENTRYGPSIDGDTQFKQYFSIRQNPRDCGTIDITAHFQQWEKLGMKLGKMHEAKVLGEAGSNGSGTSGTADFPYAKVYIGSNNSGNTGGGTGGNISSYPKGSGLRFYTQCNNSKHWAMTYDDGPTEFADAILDLLKEKNMKATFFVLGQMYMDANSSEWKRLVKRMDNEGHIVGTHTYTHPDLTNLSYQQIVDEMNKITNAVYSAIGKKPAFMRPPYGSGDGNQNVIGALQAAGYTAAITWNVDPMDYSNGGDINYAKQVINQARGRPIITLNHLKYGGASQSGILALANAEIELMLANGYTPVTMEECLGISAYQ